jgi:DHA3 family macrolide efflux protein-like MFS transporter
VVWLSFGAFGALEPLFFRDVVGAGVEALGWVNVVFGAAMVAGSLLLPKLPGRIVTARGLMLFLVLCGLGTVGYVGSSQLRFVALGAVAWGLVIGATEPLMRTLIHRDSPTEVVGRVMGTTMMHRHGGELLPLAFAPAAAAAFGVQPTLIAGGLIASAIALLSFGEARAIDRLPHRESEPTASLAAEVPLSPNS